jgi:hypothetical protein
MVLKLIYKDSTSQEDYSSFISTFQVGDIIRKKENLYLIIFSNCYLNSINYNINKNSVGYDKKDCLGCIVFQLNGDLKGRTQPMWYNNMYLNDFFMLE